MIALVTNLSFYGRWSFDVAVAGRQPPRLRGDRGAGRRRHHRRHHGALRLAGDPRPRHPRGDGAGAHEREPHPARGSRSSSRSRRRSRSAPAARSAPRVRSSRPAARSARSIGQFITVTAQERKTLLAAGAAAGMTAIFGTPVAAMLLAIELLLFEYRARSIVPVALAASPPRRWHPRVVHGAGAGVRDAGDRLADRRRWRLSSRSSAALVGVVVGLRHEVRLLDRGRVRGAADPLDVVAGARRDRRRRHRVSSRRARSASATTTSSDALAGAFGRQALVVLVRREVHLVGDRARQRHVGRHARAADDVRQRHRLAARGGRRRARCRTPASIRASARSSA